MARCVVVAVFHLTSWGEETGPPSMFPPRPSTATPASAPVIAPIVKKAAPSVVNIYSTRFIRERPMRNPFINDPFFRQFFGDQFQRR